jgi:hypothetical protein
MKNLDLKNSVKTMIVLLIVVLVSVKINAQVTIGSDKAPAKAAILEIKTQEPASNITSVTDNGNVTSGVNGGGIGLPRVKLVDRETLEPFVLTDDAEWTSPASKIKEHHAGLTVYNLTNDPTKLLRQGTYIWNGTKWMMTGGKRFFYMPSCNIEITANGNYTFDLYEEYERQFSKDATHQFVSSSSALETISALENGDLYAREELDYVITYYDSAVVTAPVMGSTTSDWGKMTFAVTDITQFSNNTFFTVMLVVK